MLAPNSYVFVIGSSGADVITGSLGTDYLLAGDRDDRLIGGQGADVLTGGAGADTFVFRSISNSLAAAPYRISDFDPSQDVIDLSAVDADALTPGRQPFTLAQSFTHAPGQLVATDTGAGLWRLDGDADGDGVADFTLLVQTVSSWTPYQDPTHLRL